MPQDDLSSLEPHQLAIQKAWLWMMRGKFDYAKDALSGLTDAQLDEAARTEPELAEFCDEVRRERAR